MARKFELMIVMLSYSAFLLILFQVAADNHSDLNVYGEEVVSDNSQWSNPDELTLDRDTTPRRELQGAASVVKGLFKVYNIWSKSKQVYEVVNWTISQVHDYIDGQCPADAESYCCNNDSFLNCESCCNGIRPDTAPSFTPSPSPLKTAPLISHILLSTFTYTLFGLQGFMV